METVSRLFKGCFPSLLHLTVTSDAVMQSLTDVPLPQLSSLTVRYPPSMVMSHISTRTFCLLDRKGCYPCFRRVHMREVLAGAPHMRQLALAIGGVWWNEREVGCHVFPPAHLFPSASTFSSPLSRLVYLEFLNGLALADLTYLLSPTSPPAFAAQLTHLALSVDWQNRATAAALLSPLPSTYTSHAHVGSQCKLSSERLAECAEWEALCKL